MIFIPPLQEAIILNRYKRFLSDITLGNEKIVAHVPNTGAMTSCWEENWRCAISQSDNPKRKLPYTLELTHNGESWIGVNTANANKLVAEWLQTKALFPFEGYQQIQPEKKIGDSRIDFYLESPELPPCYIEVKSVTLKKDGLAQFPDAVSVRGQKHLKELIKIKKSGARACLLFVIQREDVEALAPAREIDPDYSELLLEAFDMGVEIFAYQCRISLEAIILGKALPIRLD
jgi:sugar fermentation stimulation protein A